MERTSADAAAQQDVLDAFPIAAELRGADGRLHHLNPLARELYAALGLDPDVARDGAAGPFDHLEVVDQLGQPVAPADLPTAACLADGQLHGGTIGVRTAGGRASVSTVLDRRWFHLRAAPVPLADGSQGVVATALEVTRQYHLEEELRRTALHDPVTGLGNLRLLTLRHQQSQAAAERVGLLLGLVAIEVDGLDALIARLDGDAVAADLGDAAAADRGGAATADRGAAAAATPDLSGTAAADRVLSVLGQRLATVTRTADTAARTGPSSFAVLCTEVVDADDLRAAAARITEALEDGLRGALASTHAASAHADTAQDSAHASAHDSAHDSRPLGDVDEAQVTVSVGWVIVDPAMALSTALHRADRARHAATQRRDLE